MPNNVGNKMCHPHGQNFFPYKTCPEMNFSGNFPGGHRVPQ